MIGLSEWVDRHGDESTLGSLSVGNIIAYARYGDFAKFVQGSAYCAMKVMYSTERSC